MVFLNHDLSAYQNYDFMKGNIMNTPQSTLQKKIFTKDFTLIIIGQIISLFGNQILRFALPLYLLNQTGSASLFGLVSACSFIPMIILSPVGGIMADRINKRNIMVILDFATAGLTLLFTLLLGKIDLVGLMLIMLVLLYGIQGAYQPAVQASIPVLMSNENLMRGNAVINLVSSLAGLIGPVIAGAVYGFWGLYPILYASIACFTFSAIMEIFIRIPFVKQKNEENIFQMGLKDLKESFGYICKKQPAIWRLTLVLCSFNLFISSLIMISLPVMITQMLDFSELKGNRLYGYAQGVLAAGSLLGGLSAGVLSKKLKIKYTYLFLIVCAAALPLMGIGFVLSLPSTQTYFLIVAGCFLLTTISTMSSVQMMSYLQMLSPVHLLGKIIACVMCICMCANPLGQAVYGILLDNFKDKIFLIFVAAFIIASAIAIVNKKVFKEVGCLLE